MNLPDECIRQFSLSLKNFLLLVARGLHDQINVFSARVEFVAIFAVHLGYRIRRNPILMQIVFPVRKVWCKQFLFARECCTSALILVFPLSFPFVPSVQCVLFLYLPDVYNIYSVCSALVHLFCEWLQFQCVDPDFTTKQLIDPRLLKEQRADFLWPSGL